ncbi:MAG: PhzF family phenazine biosynthesis protein, partial [Bradyrhizobium sp.]|nr:PhzF family phenazine biosynthesis protein [Bradyrhizobium sp.]
MFTGTQFVGNPLAVVLNAEGLSTGQMQAIAAEFNLAETTFVLPPRDAAHTAEVRIFTPRSEMPFAGHPNVGTAFVLARAGSSYGRPVGGDRVIFEEKAGLVPIDILRDGRSVAGSRLASPQPLSVGAEVAGELVASACGVSLADIETIHHRPRIASCGAPFILVELKSRTPKTDRYHGYLDVSLFETSALVEGPIAEHLSFYAAARRSYIDYFLGLAVESIEG